MAKNEHVHMLMLATTQNFKGVYSLCLTLPDN